MVVSVIFLRVVWIRFWLLELGPAVVRAAGARVMGGLEQAEFGVRSILNGLGAVSEPGRFRIGWGAVSGTAG